jgi:uncharacterized phage protein gp47/JayE
MADLQTKNFDTLVSEQATTIQGSSKSLVDFGVGSILRSIVEAYSAVALWLQGLILRLLATTRAATSNGSDLDTWMADYGLTRLPATNATGTVTFARFTAQAQAVLPIGAVVQSGDGKQQYAVALDTLNSAYSAPLGGYVLGAGVSSITVPVQALTPGSAANAAIGGINTLGQAIPGVDTVTNAAALTNGEDPETDAALRVRFVEYIASLSKATKSAVAFAVLSVESGLTYSLVENADYDGTPHEGFFYVIVDDGSGTPSTSLLSRVYAAVDAVRPLGSTFGVFGPVVLTANVVLHVTLAGGYDPLATTAVVQAAIANYINALPLGTTLSWSRLIQVAYDASIGVTNVANLTINGSTVDLAATPKQVVKAASITVAATT